MRLPVPSRLLAALALLASSLVPSQAATVAEARALAANTAVTLDSVVLLNVVDTVSSGTSKSIQVADDTGAITVFGTNAQIDALIAGVQPGDRILGLKGWIGTPFNGLTQLINNTASPLSRTGVEVLGVAPVPLDITIDDLQAGSARAEQLESRLVRLRNVAFATGGQAFSTGFQSYTVGAGGKTAVVRVTTNDIGALFAGIVQPTGLVDVVGVLSQFDTTDPRNGDYQVLVRAPSDIVAGAFQDGAGSAAVSNGDTASPYGAAGLEKPIFAAGPTVVRVVVTGSDQGAVPVVEIDIPAAWGVPAAATVTGGGAGASHPVTITGQRLRAEGLAVTDLAPATFVVSGLTAPAADAAVPDGYWEFPVRTAVTAGGTPAAIGTAPSANVLIPVEAVRAVDGNGVPLLINRRVAVAGTLTAAPSQLSATRTEAYLQDGAFGVNIFSFTADLGVFWEVGAPYAVRGRVIQFSGLTEIEPLSGADVVELGLFQEPVPVEPLKADIVTLLSTAESFEGRLVTIPGLYLVSGTWPATPANATLVVSDGTTQLDLVLLADNAALFPDPSPAFPLEITGIFSQRTTSPTLPFSGYRLVPRSPADLAPGTVVVPPDAVDDTYTVTLGETSILDILANDSTPSGDPVIEIDDPRVTVNANGTVSFVPGEAGQTSFRYQLRDSGNRTDAAIVTITVRALPSVPPLINEFVANPPGTDVQEYIEIIGAPLTDYSLYTLVVIEGDGSGAGVIDRVITLGTTDDQGIWWTGFLPSNALENGTQTILLVRGFTGALSNDLDHLNDGALRTVWTQLVHGVGVSDGGTGDRTYAEAALLPGYDDRGGTVGGASLRSTASVTGLASDWVRNDPDGAGLPGDPTSSLPGAPGLALNTPGLPNVILPDLPPLAAYAAFRANREYFTEAESLDDLVAGPAADPDRDGLANLLEFSLGLHPRVAGASPFAAGIDGEGFLRVTFPRLPDTEVGLVVEALADLAGAPVIVLASHDPVEGWTTSVELDATVLETPTDGGPVLVEVMLPAGGVRLFVRLRATAPSLSVL